jgi:hypothetical protein
MKIILILLFIFTIGCSKNKDTIKWNDPGFSLVRTIVTNGVSLGK